MKGWFKSSILLFGALILLAVTTCSCSGANASSGSTTKRAVVLQNDNTNAVRNRLLKEDILFLKNELPKKHINLFHHITEEEFNNLFDQLAEKVDTMGNIRVFAEINKIITLVGDAHTSINYWDGYHYPLEFWIFEDKVYIVNTSTDLEEMMYSQVLQIDGFDIDSVINQLKTLISHENDQWVLAMLPNYLQSPVYMYGLGILQSEQEAVFTVEKDGKVMDYTVSALEYGEAADFSKKAEDVLVGRYNRYYSYEYLPDSKALYFIYNVCADMEDQSFAEFNKEMTAVIDENDLDKIIIDLRNNVGGNSEILNPFTQYLSDRIKGTDVRVYILVGRNTISSGMFAIYRVKDAVQEAISVGEPTGGALNHYGDINSINLPNSQLLINYSTKYFELNKMFHYKNEGVGTFLPDILLQPNIQDYMNGNDVVLNYVLTD